MTRLVVLCQTRQEAEAVLATIQAWVDQHGLRLHPEKTRVGNCMDKGQGFDFLGYRFEAGRRWVRPKTRAGLATSNTPIDRLSATLMVLLGGD